MFVHWDFFPELIIHKKPEYGLEIWKKEAFNVFSFYGYFNKSYQLFWTSYGQVVAVPLVGKIQNKWHDRFLQVPIVDQRNGGCIHFPAQGFILIFYSIFVFAHMRSLNMWPPAGKSWHALAKVARILCFYPTAYKANSWLHWRILKQPN